MMKILSRYKPILLIALSCFPFFLIEIKGMVLLLVSMCGWIFLLAQFAKSPEQIFKFEKPRFNQSIFVFILCQSIIENPSHLRLELVSSFDLYRNLGAPINESVGQYFLQSMGFGIIPSSILLTSLHGYNAINEYIGICILFIYLGYIIKKNGWLAAILLHVIFNSVLIALPVWIAFPILSLALYFNRSAVLAYVSNPPSLQASLRYLWQ